MKKNHFIILFVALLSSCTPNAFPEKKSVKELNKTDFSPAFESPFDVKKNVIYGATIPLAWKEIKKQINLPLSGFEHPRLEEVHLTTYSDKVLHSDEYQTTIEVYGDRIVATASFFKSLPFKKRLKKFKTPLNFDRKQVKSFGFIGKNKYTDINYYMNPSNFSISLLPKDEEHEIILALHDGATTDSFEKAWKLYLEQKQKFKEYAKYQDFYCNEDDRVEIPVIQFNLTKKYKEIIGSQFASTKKTYIIDEFYQENAFVLNEKGAKVKSFSKIGTKEASAPRVEAAPKIMIFNQPFFIFLKRKDAKSPYFAVYIQNEELLEEKK